MSGGIEVSCIDSVAHDEEFLVSSLLLDGPYGAREVQHLHVSQIRVSGWDGQT